jgi:UDP-2,4-diacetamido-2,4,6-trideoxy-beta-L-altropyranose hydrolase
MRILFHCEASPEIGAGHVMRCLSLAHVLINKGWECDFLSGVKTARSVSLLKASPINIFHDLIDLKLIYDVLVVDNYMRDHVDEKQWRKHARHLVVIDDLANRKHDCDILIDPTFGRDGQDYQDLVMQNTRIFTGVDYALLRPDFYQKREVTRARRAHQNGAISRILVSMGAMDAHNISALVLKAIAGHYAKQTEKPAIDIVLNKAAPHLETIKAHCADLCAAGFAAQMHIDTIEMAALMARADLAFGAAGTTSWERCALGLPTLMVQVADNQINILNGLDQASAAHSIADLNNVSVHKLQEALSDIAQNPAALKKMSARAFDICDGLGAQRTIPLLVPPTDKGVALERMGERDCKTFFKWQQNPQTRRYATTQKAPDWHEHQDWFAKIIQNPDRQLYMIKDHNEDIGMVRLDPYQGPDKKASDEPSYEISILIDPAQYGKGLAGQALSLIRNIEPRADIWAEIHPENKASRQVFARLGYEPVDETWFCSKAALNN